MNDRTTTIRNRDKRICQTYVAGSTLRRIALIEGISLERVRQILKLYDIQIRDRSYRSFDPIESRHPYFTGKRRQTVRPC